MCATYTLINKGVVVASIVKECLNSKRIFTIHLFWEGSFPPYRPQHVSIDVDVGGCVCRVAEMSIVRNGEELLLKIQQQQLTSH